MKKLNLFLVAFLAFSTVNAEEPAAPVVPATVVEAPLVAAPVVEAPVVEAPEVKTSMISRLFTAAWFPLVAINGYSKSFDDYVIKTVKPASDKVSEGYTTITTFVSERYPSMIVATALVAGSVYAYTQLNKTADKKSKN